MSELLMMNKSEMDSLSTVFVAQAAAVGDLLAKMTASLDGTTWQGARAGQFRGLWTDTFAPNLVALQTSLSENAAFITAEVSNARAAFDSVGG